jgi:hypothetical protein
MGHRDREIKCTKKTLSLF